jgi:hypothetical protein
MSKSAHPKFIGLTLTPSGGMLGAWEDGSVARWVPSDVITDDAGIVTGFTEGAWVAIPSPDYEALFCTTTKTYTRATDELNLELAPDVGDVE